MPDRLLYGVLIALVLLGGMQLLANQVEPPNLGMTETPCPPPEGRTAMIARTAFLTLAGRPNETRDWADLCFYQRDNAVLARSGTRPRVVFLGDSITQYWGQVHPGFFTDGIVNRGVAGQASAQVLLRLKPDALALKPRVVHLLVGLNDIVGARGSNRPEDYRNNIEAMLALAKASGVVVIIGAIPPAKNDGWGTGVRPVDRTRELNGWLRNIARRDGLVFAEYWTAMAAPDGTMRPGLADDGVHPNGAGYAAMEPVARAAMAEAEQRLAQAPPG